MEILHSDFQLDSGTLVTPEQGETPGSSPRDLEIPVEVDEIEGENGRNSREEDERSNVEVDNEETVDVEVASEAPTENVEERMRADGLGDKKSGIMRMLQEELSKKVIEDPISLRFYDRKSLKTATAKVYRTVRYLDLQDPLQSNRILKASTCVVMRLLGIVKKQLKKTQEPWWKKRLNGQIRTLRQDLSKLESLKNNMLKNDNTKDRLYEKKKLFEKLEGIEIGEDAIPDAEASIWEKDVSHNERAEWKRSVEKEVQQNIERQDELSITLEMLRKQASKLSNWKAPGPDGVQGYWIKNVKSIHPMLTAMFNDSLISGIVPEWLTKGRTVLSMKDKTRGIEVTNYRPITCLFLMWKLFISIISEKIYSHLDSNGLLPEEQKGCRKKSRGTKDQLLIDKAIIKNCKRRKIDLAMGWIDYKKAFDMIPQSWILRCLEMLEVADNIRSLLGNSMKNWETELTSGKCRVPVPNIGPIVNHLLYMDDLRLFGKTEKQLDTLMNTVRIFSDDIRKEFGIKKCRVLAMKKSRHHKSDGIKLTSADKIKEIDIEERYKYLGVLEADGIKDKIMKENVRKEYIRRVKKTVLTNKKSKFLEKKLHSVFFKATEFRGVKSWEWLRKGDLKKATEGTLMAGQEQAIKDKINTTPN
ncbi:uncharacterized protein LOC134784476 [Penaeus indicus]|uniref:uncharacterized protein LOC134784476 n=1 Tax=Penaeus indicus TaxID=29960 RepID=UPI00300D1097